MIDTSNYTREEYEFLMKYIEGNYEYNPKMTQIWNEVDVSGIPKLVYMSINDNITADKKASDVKTGNILILLRGLW